MNNFNGPFRLIHQMTAMGEPRAAARTPRALHRSSCLLPLEQRFMFDAAAVATAAEAAQAKPNEAAHALIPDVAAPVPVREADASLNSGKKEVVFIDTSVADYKALEAGIRAGMEIREIDGSRSGLAQLSKWAESHSGYDAIHILSHGSDALLRLGTDDLTEAKLSSRTTQAELAELGQALKAGGDLLIYACDVASSPGGHHLVSELANLTGADVAASTDNTGAQALGGNWVLEARIGSIEASTLKLSSYSQLLTQVNFDFDGDTTNGDMNSMKSQVTVTVGSDTLVIDSQGEGMYVGNVGPSVSDGPFLGSPFTDNNLAVFSFGGNYQTSVALSVQGGKLFNLDAFAIGDTVGENETITLTTNTNKTYTFSLPGAQNGGDGAPRTIDVASNTGTDFQNISSVTITSADNTFVLALDNIKLSNIHSANNAPSLTAPGTVVTYTDTAANDTFSNQSGTLSATDADNDTLTYGISSGTTGGSTTISGTTYDVSKSGSYGTLYVKSSTGDYVFVPGATAINAASSSTTDTFTVTVSDGNGGSDSKTLTVGITAANDTPSLTAPSTISLTDTAAADTFSNQTGTLSASDRDTGASLTYGISSGTTGGSTTISGTTYDVSKAGSYGTLYVKSSTGAYVYVPSASAINALSGSTSESFTVTTSDGSLSDSQTLTVNLSGANDTPVNTAAPSVSGTAAVGNALSATTGTFTDAEGTSLTYTYQWYRADDNSGTNATAIGSATSSSYTLTSSEAHKYVRVAVTASDGSLTASANSSWTQITNSAPSNSAAPTISGTTSVGNALSVTAGTWSDADGDTLSYSYQWYRADDNSGTNASAIAGATSSNYTLTSSELNKYVRVAVTANDSNGSSNQTANSSWTAILDAPGISSIVRTGSASSTVATTDTSVSYTVTFSESVTGVDASDFTLTHTGNASGSIASISGSGTTYTVTVGTLSGDGTLRLDLNSSGTGIQNGSSVAIASGYTSGQTYTLDHTAPSAPSITAISSDTGSSSSDGITSDQTLSISGTSEANATVEVFKGGVSIGTTTANGSGNWSYDYTGTTLAEGNHTFTAKATDTAGNTSSASSGLTVTIDTTSPTVSSVSVPSNGSYKSGQTLSFTVNTSETVTVDTSGGTPRLALTIGSSTVYADYASGSGSSALVFSYTVQAGDTDSDGIAVTALESNGGTLKDTAGNNMTLTLNSVGTTSGVLVDNTAPIVNSVSVPSNGTYYSNQNLDFTVNFSEAVTVNTSGGTPRIALTLDTGGTAYATYQSGSGTSALVFRYTVADGVKDETGVTVGTLSANGGTLKDAAGNDATLTLNSVGSTASVNVDGTQPSILDVTSSTADGSYKAGDTISITLTFSTAVTVDTTGGTPTLALNSGGSASYTSGSGSTTLVFTYTVGASENAADLDYSATGSLSLNGGTIKDSGGTHLDASLTLATPGASSSLGANKDIVIDTAAPTITFSNLAFSNDSGISSTDFITRITGQTITATLSAAPAGTDKVYGSLNGGTTWTDVTSKVSGTTLTWNGVTLTGSNTLKLKVTDSAGNDGTVTSQPYVLSTGAPSITISNLALSNDTGISSTDFITKTAAQTITATLSAVPDALYGSLDGGTTWIDLGGKVSGTTLTWNNVTLSGSNTLKFKAADIAGGEAIVASQAYVLDTIAPTAAIATAAFSADTGISSTDFITKTAAQTISGTLTSNLGTGETVYVSLDNGNTWTAASASQNTWSLAGQSLTSSNTFKVKVMDAAGNESPIFSQAYVLDTEAPSIAISDLALSNDTGISSTDFITKTAAQTITATLSTAPASTDKIYGSLDAGATWVDLTDKVSGTRLTWDKVTLSGSNTLKLKAVDVAGNEAIIGSQVYVLDTIAPTATVATAAFSADTGVSSTDFITKADAQIISGTLTANLRAGEAVYVSLDNGTTWTAASTSQNTWSLAGQSLISSNTLKIKVMDAAGNEGPIFSQVYVLDIVSPAVPTVESLSTTSITPVMTGSVSLGTGESLTVTVDGALYHVTPSGGSWSLDLASATPVSGSIALAAGKNYSVTATVTDIAGNTTSASGMLSIAVLPVNTTATTTTTIITTTATTSSASTTVTTPEGSQSTSSGQSAITTSAAGGQGASTSQSGSSTAGPTPATTFLPPTLESAISNSVLASGTSFAASGSAAASPSFATPRTPVADILGESSQPGRNSLTQGSNGSFQVMVVNQSSLNGEGLMLNRGIADQVVQTSGRTEISIPPDAFAHTDPNAAIRLAAQQVNGQPLPNWVSFDGRSGKFIVEAPKGVTGELSIKVVARDAQGREVVSIFKIRVGTKGAGQAQPERSGRVGLSEQLRVAATRHKDASGSLERLAKLSQMTE